MRITKTIPLKIKLKNKHKPYLRRKSVMNLQFLIRASKTKINKGSPRNNRLSNKTKILLKRVKPAVILRI